MVQKVLIFVNFCPKSAHFCKFPVIFCTFLLIFYTLFLAYFTQTIQINLLNSIFNSKTNIPLKKNLKKS